MFNNTNKLLKSGRGNKNVRTNLNKKSRNQGTTATEGKALTQATKSKK